MVNPYTKSKRVCLLLLLIATFLYAADQGSTLEPDEGFNFALGKRVRVSTNGAEEKYAGAGAHFEAITDGSLSYRCYPAGEVRKSDGDHGGCVGWVNDTYHEELAVTVKIDLQESIRITKIRYTMGDCFRAETWGADSMTTPLGTIKCNSRGGSGCAWTEQKGDVTASTVEIVFKKTRTSYATDWLFIGEIEVIGSMDTGGSPLSGVAPILAENVHSNGSVSRPVETLPAAERTIRKSAYRKEPPSLDDHHDQSELPEKSLSPIPNMPEPDGTNTLCAILNKVHSWAGKNGIKIDAKFVAVSDDGDTVTLEKTDGTTIQTEIARLTSDGQKTVATMAQFKRCLEKEHEWRCLQALVERYPFKLKNGVAVERSVAADSWFIESRKLKGQQEKITAFGFVGQGITNEVRSLTEDALKIRLTSGKQQELLWEEQSFVILVNGREMDRFATTADYCNRGLKMVSEKEKQAAEAYWSQKRYAEKQHRFTAADQKVLKALTRQICAHPFILRVDEPIQRGINVGGWIFQNVKLEKRVQTLTADSISIFYGGFTNTLLAVGGGKLQFVFDDKTVQGKPVEVSNIVIKKNKDTDGSDIISYSMVEDMIFLDENEKTAILIVDDMDGDHAVRMLKYAILWKEQPFIIMTNGKEVGRFKTTMDYIKRGIRVLPFSVSLKMRKNSPD